MPEDAIVEALRAENTLLLAEVANCKHNQELVLVFLIFILTIVFAVVLALREEILHTWRHYDEVFLLAHHKSKERLMRMHDNFNLLVLPGIVYLDFRFVLGGGLNDESNPRFWNFLWFTVVYITIDMLWVATFPKCVKSQTTILVHHAVTLLYMGIPMYNPLTRYAMAVCLLVELNTWFLILRRTAAGTGPFRYFVTVPFYISWYVIRIGIYPYMIYDVYQLFLEHLDTLKRTGDPAWVRSSYGLTYMAIPPLFQTALTALNVHWTVALIKSQLKNKGPDKGL